MTETYETHYSEDRKLRVRVVYDHTGGFDGRWVQLFDDHH